MRQLLLPPVSTIFAELKPSVSLAKAHAVRAGVLAALAVGSVALPSHAQQDGALPRLQVERDEGAGECPDEPALRLAVERIREERDRGKAPYRVRFSRDGAAFAVSITAEPSGRARTLTSGDATCDAIANATAVTLALLFDAESHEAPPPAAPVAPAPPALGPAPSPIRGTLSVGAGALVGVTAPVALALAGEAGILTDRFRAALGVGWAPPEGTRLEPGEVRTELAFGSVRLCLAPLSGALRLDLCSGLHGGVATAQAAGYTVNHRREREWLAVPLEVVASVWTPSIGVELGAGVLLPIARGDFGVDGLGVAYRSAAVGGMAWVRFTPSIRIRGE